MPRKKQLMEVLNPLPYYEANPKLKDFLDEFIDKVFNYYNGRINVTNTNITLVKEWSPVYITDFIPFRGFMLGYYLNNVIILYIPSIILLSTNVLKYDTEEDLKERNNTFMIDVMSSIVCTIIHELYHADQSKLLYNYKIFSRETQEAQVYRLCIEYIINHPNDIYNQFGFWFSNSVIKDQIDQYVWNYNRSDINSVHYYKRVTNEDLILNYFIGMTTAFDKHERFDTKIASDLIEHIKNTPNCVLEIDFDNDTKDYSREPLFIDFKTNNQYMDYNEFVGYIIGLNENLVYSMHNVGDENKLYIAFGYGNKVMIERNMLFNKKQYKSFKDMTNIE